MIRMRLLLVTINLMMDPLPSLNKAYSIFSRVKIQRTTTPAAIILEVSALAKFLDSQKHIGDSKILF